MYRLSIPPSKKNIITLMDDLVRMKELHIPDPLVTRNLGIYIKPWRDRGFISIYNEMQQQDTLIRLNVSGVEKAVRPGKRIDYLLDKL